MVVTAAVRRSLRISGRLVPADVRLGQVAVTLVVSITLFVLALHVPVFMAAGADMTDSAQRDYAANLWQGAPWGRRILLVIATAGVVLTTWFALLSAQSYAALPQQVSGVVDRVEA